MPRCTRPSVHEISNQNPEREDDRLRSSPLMSEIVLIICGLAFQIPTLACSPPRPMIITSTIEEKCPIG